jgi:hypothetical protein
MNSAINYYSAAQRHSDAIRDARRNPPIAAEPTHEPAERVHRRGLLSLVARRKALQPALSRH